MVWALAIYTALALLTMIVIWEWLRSKAFAEGFTDGVVPEFFGKYFPRRYDIVPGQQRESEGWVRNPRYFEGYVDLQQLGYKGDFCRVVEKEDVPESRIMACALAGQEGLDPYIYRTDSARAGMIFSRDDYFRDVNGDGRDDYGRIVKVEKAPNDRWIARVVPAGISRFKAGPGSELQDNSPPPHIKDLLWFYEGAMVWYRWIDDMLDYAENTQIAIAGEAKVDEEPGKKPIKGLEFNKIPSADASVPPPNDQYLKIGENARLEFDSIVQLRQLRAISVWAYFEEFTNNARIFDFGNGAGKDNVFLGIEGRGNSTQSTFGTLGPRPTDQNLVCRAKPAPEMSPQAYLARTDANVDEWECPGPEPMESTYPEDEKEADTLEPTANLLFEVWDTQQRKMRIKVLDVIPLKKWVHIALTTTDNKSFRPTWHVYINGKKVYEEPDGHMPLASYVTQNYIGRSNWEGVSSQYADADERFRGALFDFRLYRTPMSSTKILRTVEWGLSKLKPKQNTNL